MKYYRGTRRRKRSSKSKLSSPESQNTSISTEGNEVSRDKTTTISQENATGRKRPSSTLPLTEKQSTGRTKRAKTTHTTPEEESNTKNKNSKINTEKHPDSSDENEPKMSRDGENTVRNTTSRSRGSRRDGTSGKRTKSNEVIKSNNTSSVAEKTRKTSRKSNKSAQRNSKTSNKTKSKPIEPNSPTSSETEESVFEDYEEEIQQTIRSKEVQSNVDIFSGDVNSDGAVISYSEFLQQQVRILKSEFEIEDCPELAASLQGTKRQQQNHIPKEIVLKVLRKLNFKIEDELLKSLNRQAQRNILKQVEEIRSSHGVTGKKRCNEECTGQEPEGNVEKLRKKLEKSTEECDGLKKLTDMAADIESMVEGFSTHPLVEEVKRTNELVKKINQKVKKEAITNRYQDTLTTKGPLSHQEIVNKLFS